MGGSAVAGSGPLVALAVLVPILTTLFFVLRVLPWSRPGPWRLIWLMAVLSATMFVLAEGTAALDETASGLADAHQLPLFGSMLSALTGFVLVYRLGYREALRSQALALTDPLTAASNRRAFEERVALAIEREEPFSIAYVDLDGFKKVNDAQGHASGDSLLRRTADLLRRAARQIDMVARVGGDEFALVLVGAGEEATRVVCERILHLAATDPDPIRCSIGVATYRRGLSPREIIGTADRAMYQAKAAGGSQVAQAT